MVTEAKIKSNPDITLAVGEYNGSGKTILFTTIKKEHYLVSIVNDAVLPDNIWTAKECTDYIFKGINITPAQASIITSLYDEGANVDEFRFVVFQ